MKYSLALEYAQEIKEILSPFCERIEIAGGIRRQKEEPHDIEIVCQPRSLPAIFTDYDNEVNMLDHTIKKGCEDYPDRKRGAEIASYNHLK